MKKVFFIVLAASLFCTIFTNANSATTTTTTIKTEIIDQKVCDYEGHCLYLEWYSSEGKIYFTATPVGDFFFCYVSFAIVQNGTQYSVTIYDPPYANEAYLELTGFVNCDDVKTGVIGHGIITPPESIDCTQPIKIYYDDNFITLNMTCAPDKGPCPAQAAFNNDISSLQPLRNFRDQVLNRSLAGRAIINIYYKTGPTMCKIIDASPQFKQLYKAALKMTLKMLPATYLQLSEPQKQ